MLLYLLFLLINFSSIKNGTIDLVFCKLSEGSDAFLQAERALLARERQVSMVTNKRIVYDPLLLFLNQS